MATQEEIDRARADRSNWIKGTMAEVEGELVFVADQTEDEPIAPSDTETYGETEDEDVDDDEIVDDGVDDDEDEDEDDDIIPEEEEEEDDDVVPDATEEEEVEE